MFSRTWITVLAGSVALWGMSRLGEGVLGPDVGAGSAVPASAHGSAGTGLRVWRHVWRRSLRLTVRLRPDGSSVVQRYRERCRPLVGGAAFDAFALVYGERSRAVVLAILEREERLAAELIAGPQGRRAGSGCRIGCGAAARGPGCARVRGRAFRVVRCKGSRW